MKNILIAAILLCSATLTGSAMAQAMVPGMQAADIDTFHAFGDKQGLVKLTDVFMVRLLANPLTGPVFADVNQQHVKDMLVMQFCQVMSGPCTYEGLDMKTAHSHFKINKAQFNALVEELQFSMDAEAIPFTAQNRLLAQLAPMYKDIITDK